MYCFSLGIRADINPQMDSFDESGTNVVVSCPSRALNFISGGMQELCRERIVFLVTLIALLALAWVLIVQLSLGVKLFVFLSLTILFWSVVVRLIRHAYGDERLTPAVASVTARCCGLLQ